MTCQVTEGGKRLALAFAIDDRGFTKTGVNGLIEVLKKLREKMVGKLW